MRTRTGHLHADDAPALELRVLEAIADGQPLPVVLASIARGLEALIPDWRVSLLQVSSDGLRLLHGAAPSLPDAFVRAIDGLPIGPVAGSCGTAAHRRGAVLVEDIATDPLWADYRDVAVSHGLRACWSVPIIDREGSVLATFAVYHAAPMRPERAHLDLIGRFARLARVAIQHDRAQRALRDSEERFRTVFRDLGLGLGVADRSGRLLIANPAYHAMLGYAEGELEGLTVEAITHPDDRAQTRARIEDLIEGRCDRYVLEKRFQRKDGSHVWARVTGSARRDADGHVADFIGVIKDITSEREAEQERRRQQALLQMASRVGHLGAWTLDASSRRLELTEEARAIHGLGSEGPDDPESLLATFDPSHRDAVRTAIDACLNAGTPVDQEFRLTSAPGRTRWVRLIGEPVRDAEGRIVRIQGALQDITERRLLEQQSLRSQRLESIGTLAGGIAHDLNNVLSPITMGVGLLRRDDHDATRQELFDVIQSSAERATHMVQQVLSFARGADGRRSRVDPGQVVRDTTALLRETLPRRIRIETDIAPDAGSLVADPTQLHQVIVNLCVNARDAMPHGGLLRLAVSRVPAGGWMRPAGDAGGEAVRIVVEDTGTGIAPEVIDRIFDPFFSTKPTGSGTGLGLSTSLGIVRSHGGRIDVSSTPGHGSRFEVYLPVASDVVPPVAPSTGQASATRGHGTVLLVDDEPDLRLMARRALERSGYRVIEAANGEEALALFDRHRGDITVVLTDMMMPGMDGADLVRGLRGRAAAVPIVGMSGLGRSERLTDADSALLTGFLHKPFTPDTLRRALEQATERKAPPRDDERGPGGYP